MANVIQPYGWNADIAPTAYYHDLLYFTDDVVMTSSSRVSIDQDADIVHEACYVLSS